MESVRFGEPDAGVHGFAVGGGREHPGTGAAHAAGRPASRLDALLRDRHLDITGAAAPLAELRALLDELRGDAALRVPASELDRLWQRMQELLDRLGGPGGDRKPIDGGAILIETESSRDDPDLEAGHR